MSNHKYNWRPDIPDQRDKYYSTNKMFSIEQLPSLVDLRPQMPPIVDQGTVGSCTANALSGVLGFLEMKALKNKIASVEILNSTSFESFSRLFIYYNERLIEGDINQDGGAQLRDGIKSLTGYGACSESLWDYDVNLLFQKPTDNVYEEAYKHRISSYYRIQTLLEMKHSLAQGLPFVFGFTVYESFESPLVAATGLMPVPSQTEDCLGGHAIAAVGFDDSKQCLIIRNSWGSGWGDKGYFYMPYMVASNPDLATDFWSIAQ